MRVLATVQVETHTENAKALIRHLNPQTIQIATPTLLHLAQGMIVIMDTDYITKSTLKAEYGLTDSLIKKLGEPDRTKPNPHYRNAPDMQLYDRERVEQWIVENDDLMQRAMSRKKSANQAVETKRENAKREAAALIGTLMFYPMPRMDKLIAETTMFLLERYGHDDVNAKSICSYVRHHYTNYHNILACIFGKVGKHELYIHAKVLLCCRVIRHLHLENQLTPLAAANVESDRYPDDLGTVETAMLNYFGLANE